MTIDFRDLPARQIAEDVRAGRVKATEMIGAALDRIAAVDGDVGAFVRVDAERAQAEAAAVDDAVAAGHDPGPLAGVPLAVKDVMDVAGWPTTHGSACHLDDPPATEDALIVERLRAAGAVVVGKTNAPEHGWKADTVSMPFGRTANPWSLAHSTGGSSGGSAAALAAGMVPLATGSDGGGSIRIPASVCGLPGFKPSFGRIPNAGRTAPDWLFLSTHGPMTYDLEDLGVALDAVVGPHLRDPECLPAPVDKMSAALSPNRPGPARVAWSPDLGFAPVDDEVRAACAAAVARLDDAGCEVVELDRVFDEDPVGQWASVANTGILRALLPYESRWDEMDPGLRESIEWARDNVSAVDLVRAIDAGHELSVQLADVFATADVLITPTCAGIAGRDGRFGTIGGEEDLNWVRFTYPFNLTRSPAASMPIDVTHDGLPMGLQIVGPRFGDDAVLAAMAWLAQISPFEPRASAFEG